jgi:hypothetical protein
VPGATAGLLSEVIVADAGSHDATREVADIAGCRFMISSEPLGARLKAAAAATRTPWLLFLRAGCVPESDWVGAVDHFMEASDRLNDGRAAVFRPPRVADLLRSGLAELLALLRAMLGGGLKPGHGLLIARRHYDSIGGHSGDDTAEAAMLRRIGRRRLAMLPAAARTAR